MVSILFAFERKVLKSDGVTSLAMSSIAGMSAGVPPIIVAAHPALHVYVSASVAQIVMGVVLTSLITPMLIKRLVSRKNTSAV